MHVPWEFLSGLYGLALLRLVANYAFSTKNSKGLVRYATLVSMWLFGFASTLMVVFFIAYCAILACWILVVAVRNCVGILMSLGSAQLGHPPKIHATV